MLPISLQSPVLHDCILFDTMHPTSHVFKCTHLLWGENYKCRTRLSLPMGTPMPLFRLVVLFFLLDPSLPIYEQFYHQERPLSP